MWLSCVLCLDKKANPIQPFPLVNNTWFQTQWFFKSDIGDILSAEFSDDDDNPKDKKNAEFPIKGSYNPKRKGKVRRSISFGDEQDKDKDIDKEKEGKGGVSFGDSSDNTRRRRRSSGRRGSNDPLRSSGTLRNSGGSAGSVDLLDSELNSELSISSASMNRRMKLMTIQSQKVFDAEDLLSDDDDSDWCLLVGGGGSLGYIR